MSQKKRAREARKDMAMDLFATKEEQNLFLRGREEPPPLFPRRKKFQWKCEGKMDSDVQFTVDVKKEESAEEDSPDDADPVVEKFVKSTQQFAKRTK